MNKTVFEQTVTTEFRFLQDRYNFSAPVVEDFGREIFIKYDRVDQTISISYEFGGSPLIEIFHPSDKDGEVYPTWASKNGVKRIRRFPKLKLGSRFSNDETSIVKYIKEMSTELERVESDWLKI